MNGVLITHTALMNGRCERHYASCSMNHLDQFLCPV